MLLQLPQLREGQRIVDSALWMRDGGARSVLLGFGLRKAPSTPWQPLRAARFAAAQFSPCAASAVSSDGCTQ